MATYKDDDEDDEEQSGNKPSGDSSTVIKNEIHISGNNNGNTSNTTTYGDTSTINNITKEETVGNLNSNAKLPLPIIICLAVGGLIVLAAIAVGVFFIVRKPKTAVTEEKTED